jgi:DNA-binding transcriptional MerR regulator
MRQTAPADGQPAREDPLFISYADVAALIGVSVETVRNYVRRGLIPPPLRFSKRTLLFDRAAVEEALRQRAM